MKNMSFTGIILALCAAILWGTAGTAQSFAHSTASPYWIGAFRLFFACAIFYILFILNRKNNISTASTAGYKPRILITGCCMALFNLLFFVGVKTTGVAVGSATIIGSAPVWAGLIQAVISRKSPLPIWWVGTCCAIAGGFAMTIGKGTELNFSAGGLLICLSAGFCYAMYSIISKQLVSMAAPLTITTHTFSVAALIAVPAAFIIAGKPVIISTDWLIVLYLGAFTTVLAYLLYAKALKHISAPTGVSIGLFEPITAFVLAITIVGERASLLSICGLVMILCGLCFVLRAELKNK